MSKTVLFVQEDPNTVDAVTFILKNVGCDMVHSTPASYLADIAAFSPQLILIEYHLAGELGDQLCRNIKEMRPFRHTPIILASGEPDLENIAVACGADDILPKPYNAADLEQKVIKWLYS